MRKMFKWKDGAQVRINAEAVGRELTKIQKKHNGLFPQDIVDTARSPESPLHKGFEWDDTKAAEQHRLSQARYMVRMLVIVEEVKAPPVRAFVSIRDDNQKHAYQPLYEVLSNDEWRQQALGQAVRDLEAFRRKYRELTELSEVLLAADRILVKYG